MMDPEVASIHHNTINRVKKWTKFFYTFIDLFTKCYCCFPIVVSTFKYVTRYDNESFQQILPATYPFDWKTPFGYIGCIIIQTLIAYISAHIYIIGVVLTFGFCVLITSFVADIEEKLHRFNRGVNELTTMKDLFREERKKMMKKRLTVKILHEWQKNKDSITEKQNKLKIKLHEIIQFYSEAREFAIRFSDTNNGIVFSFLTYVVAACGSLLLHTKNVIVAGNAAEIMLVVTLVIANLAGLFFFCHFGGNMTQRFLDVGDAVYQLDWYELPVSMQKDILMTIKISQKPIYMRGFGDTHTTYSAFREIVIHKFYFFVLKISLDRLRH